MMKIKAVMLLTTNTLCSGFTFAQTPNAYDACLLEQIKNQSPETSIHSVRLNCQSHLASASDIDVVSTNEIHQEETLAIQRIKTERATERETAFQPYVITAHRLNYLLPVTYSDSINSNAYSDISGSEDLQKTEAEFQISFKLPLNYDDLLFENDGLYFGMTLKSFWQVYSKDISSPFRETNYRPEVFYIAPTPWSPFGGETAFGVGFEHESNGQSLLLSRSWNRVYGKFYFAKDNFALSFQPWWRIPEDEKDSPTDAKGDDNPDIEDYLGHFELSSVYKWEDIEFSFLGRENFSTHKGYAELGLTFPIWGKIRGYAKYSSGYGSSLIDYNQNQQRIGLGIAINELL